VKKCLDLDPKKRPKASDILSHQWMVGDVTPRKILPNFTDKLRQYHLAKKVKVRIPLVFANGIGYWQSSYCC
jgi:serine/threonine protein kinase